MIISGVSGNEVYFLARKGLFPGELTVGNSVQSLGLAGSLGSSLRTLAGGEIENITQMISHGRHAAIRRMGEEA
ncbi:MAG: heavy metal-binding domain-containing protein [Polyangiaceae bacterium]|nr:heavy metal-binding domain-containing protein [Polyangiaceae bacterium]